MKLQGVPSHASSLNVRGMLCENDSCKCGILASEGNSGRSLRQCTPDSGSKTQHSQPWRAS